MPRPGSWTGPVSCGSRVLKKNVNIIPSLAPQVPCRGTGRSMMSQVRLPVIRRYPYRRYLCGWGEAPLSVKVSCTMKIRLIRKGSWIALPSSLFTINPAARRGAPPADQKYNKMKKPSCPAVPWRSPDAGGHPDIFYFTGFHDSGVNRVRSCLFLQNPFFFIFPEKVTALLPPSQRRAGE